jgi:hypothetical protein
MLNSNREVYYTVLRRTHEIGVRALTKNMDYRSGNFK